MKISQLVKKLALRFGENLQEAEITGLFYDSRQVRPGGAFFALRGQQADGHRFIDEAVTRGARVVIMEEERRLPDGVVPLVVEDARRTMALAAAAFYGDPTAGIPVVGVTGTNGKTTVTYLVESILRAAGRNPAVFGTISYRYGNRSYPAPNTTPESVDLLRTIAEFRAAGADALIMEVSSHALEQQRVAGVHFEVAAFTNLTAEHLDYHGDMESYFASKRRLFIGGENSDAARAVINIDDPYGERLAKELPEALTCGIRARIRPAGTRLSIDGIEGEVATPEGTVSLRSALVGEFNLQNLLCAVGVGISLNIAPATIAEGLAGARQVPGRLERIDNDRGVLILVDYAHTGDALEKALQALRDLSPSRLIAVFGCGGDRDPSKRPVMGEIAARLADVAIITSDNPRGEDPLRIIEAIRQGATQVHPAEWPPAEAAGSREKGFVTIVDRREAIRFAVSLLRPGEVLLVAGKGHEDYQIVGRERLHFDDRQELRRALAATEAP